jgi:hypothetical protein
MTGVGWIMGLGLGCLALRCLGLRAILVGWRVVGRRIQQHVFLFLSFFSFFFFFILGGLSTGFCLGMADGAMHLGLLFWTIFSLDLCVETESFVHVAFILTC